MAPVRTRCGSVVPWLLSPLSLMYFEARQTNGLPSCVPFSSTSFHRWLPSPPMFTRVPLSPIIRVELSESLPKLVA